MRNNSLISILKTGRTIYGNYLFSNELKDLINNTNKLSKNKNTSTSIKSYLNMLEQYKNSSYRNYFYFNLVDEIRKKYTLERGFNYISGLKAYNLYQKKEYAKKFYCLNLPNQSFIDLYLNSIESEYNEENLKKLLAIINYDKRKYYDKHFLSSNEIKMQSIIVNNNLVRCLNYLSTNNPNALNAYYLTIEKIRILYCMINYINCDITNFLEEYDFDFISLLNKTIKNISSNNIIELFNYVTKSIKINYKDYKILINK